VQPAKSISVVRLQFEAAAVTQITHGRRKTEDSVFFIGGRKRELYLPGNCPHPGPKDPAEICRSNIQEPLSERDWMKPREVPAWGRSGCAVGAGNAMKTLVVEDDFTSRLILQIFLSRYGECHIAVNGKEAIQAFQLAKDGGKKYNLICMDITMPEMDGHEALKAIRALEEAEKINENGRARVVMTTSHDDMEDIVAARQSSCDAYLLKPIDTTKLYGHLKAFGLL
jgi:two-component system chemotaxis response regulator CheY